MKKLKAFTLTELLVALGIISILCAILLPMVFNLMPNQNTIMAKRTFYAIQTIISDLINDDACYPDRTVAIVDKKIGFDDSTAYPNCTSWSDMSITTTSQDKFITLVKERLNIKSEGTSFQTPDGVIWSFTDFAFDSTSDTGGSVHLTVDVNGREKPNCAGTGYSYNEAFNETIPEGETVCKDRTHGFDRFQMTIQGDGKIDIAETDTWAINAIQVNRNITSDNNSNIEDN